MQKGSSPGTSSRRSLSSITSASARLDALSLGVVGADNRQAVIIEIGAALTKIGYAGEFIPRSIIRTEIKDSTGNNLSVFDKSLSASDSYNRLLQFFRLVFYKYALTVAKDHRVVIVESVLTPSARRNAIAKVLFEALDAPSVLFAPSHLLATFPFGVSDALVIDLGYTEAVVAPILSGVTMLYQLEVSKIGAQSLQNRAYELLRKHGRVVVPDGSERALEDGDEALLYKENVLEDIIVRFCFATTMERGKKIQDAGFNLDGDVPSPPHDILLPLGENKLVIPGLIREWTAELIFEQNNDVKSLPQIVLDTLFRCPIDSRRMLLESLIVVGGPTKMKGFYARLRDEILQLLNHSPYANKLGKIKSVKFYRLPFTSIELYANWIGGSMFGALDVLQYRSLTRESWLKCSLVPDWITNVFEMNADLTKSR